MPTANIPSAHAAPNSAISITSDPRQARGAIEVLDLVETLSQALKRVRISQAKAARLRLPAFTLLSLANSSAATGLTVSDAAQRMGIRPQALSSQVADLVEQGLLVREVDQTDGRARRLHITEKGRDRLEMGGTIRDKLLEEVLNQIPSPSVARLVLSRLEAAVNIALTKHH